MTSIARVLVCVLAMVGTGYGQSLPRKFVLIGYLQEVRTHTPIAADVSNAS